MKSIFSPAVVFVSFMIPLHADVLTPVQQFFGMGGQMPAEGYEDLQAEYRGPDRAPFSAADSDLGVQEILAPTTTHAPFLLDVTTAAYFTDNAPTTLPGGAMEPSWLWYTRATGAWRPHLINGWHADLSATQEFLWFDRTAARNYENSTLRLGVVRSFADWDDTLLFARYEYQRLTTGSFSDADYNAQRIRAGVRKAVWETARQSVHAGADLTYEFMAKPEVLKRNSAGVELAHRYRFTPQLFSLVSWRSTFFDFSEFDREDWAHSLGLELVWQMTSSVRANVSVFFDQNDSNAPLGANDYKAWTAGAGLGLFHAF